MKTIEDIINQIIEREGDFVDHPDDKGGPTRWGTTEKVARAHGYQGRMQDLPRELAFQIYLEDYWRGPRFDQIYAIAPTIAIELADTGVNCGPAVQSKWLQRWLSAMNQKGSLYPDLLDDGQIGNRTLTALRLYLAHRGAEGERVLLRALNCSQGAYYLDITLKNQNNESFVYGWLANRVGALE